MSAVACDQNQRTLGPQRHLRPVARSVTAGHVALFYRGQNEYVQGVLEFALLAIRAGEPLAVAVPGPRAELLRHRLEALGARPEIVDMVELGRNPARIIPAVEAMRARHRGSLLHYVGEPIWAGRSQEEVREATRYEALINLAWPRSEIRVLCPYDVETLDPAILDDAERTHPHLIKDGRSFPSPRYRGPSVPLGSAAPLPDPPPHAKELRFGLGELAAVRARVKSGARSAGLSCDREADLVLAVNELATNTIRHGGGRGRLRVWVSPGSVMAQIEDSGHIADPLAGRRIPAPDVAGGVGLWTVNQLCDLVEVRSGPDGTAVRVHVARN